MSVTPVGQTGIGDYYFISVCWKAIVICSELYLGLVLERNGLIGPMT